MDKGKWATALYFALTVLLIHQLPADGAYFSRHSSAESGDQRVIIIRNGEQISMTFLPSYTGEGEELAWIIPTPVPLNFKDVREAGEVGVNLFKILDYSTAPLTLFYAGKNGWRFLRRLVTVHRTLVTELHQVGILAAASGLPPLRWLQENGYEVSPTSQKILNSYVEQDWAFVAVELKPRETVTMKANICPR